MTLSSDDGEKPQHKPGRRYPKLFRPIERLFAHVVVRQVERDQ